MSSTLSTTLVKDVMTPHPVCVDPATTVTELAELFDANGISGAPVLDGQDRVVGIVSKTDLVRRCVEGPLGSSGSEMSAFLGLAAGAGPLDPEDLGTVQDFMTNDLVTSSVEESIATVAKRMAEHQVHRVVVTDSVGRAVGILTTLDVLDTYPD